MIWDLQEGVVAGEPTVEERWDHPVDLAEQRRSNDEMARKSPLAQPTGRITTTSLRVRECEQSSLVYGDNCLIWCSSIKPRNRGQWSSWQDSLESSYDHISTIRNPHVFARALGAMAFQQKGLLGDAISFRKPQTEYPVQCASLPVVYGPVVYVDNRRAYIGNSSTDLEFVVRSIFSKTSEHRHQREYRFAILSNRDLADNTLDLQVSTELRWCVAAQQSLEIPKSDIQAPAFRTCLPSPRILSCLQRQPSTQRVTDRSVGEFTSQITSSFHLAVVHHKETTTARRAVTNIQDVDYEYLEESIVEEPTSPSDARILKFVFDAGLGSEFTAYDLGGLSMTFRLSKRSGKAVLTANDPEVSNGERLVLIDTKGFDGSSLLGSGQNELKLSYIRANTAIAVRTDVSDLEDKIVTVTATSEDGTSTSSFKIIFDRSLGINITSTAKDPAK